MSVVRETDFSDLKLLRRGKVRDIYEIGQYLLFIATDRLSAFDVVLPDCIPSKGEVLTAISTFWFSFLKDIVGNHLQSTDISEFPEVCHKYNESLKGRALLVKKAVTFPVECIVRGYISGSAWSEYKKSGKVCGISLPEGLKESDKLNEPIFTPSTKAEHGHDINISFDEASKLVGASQMEKLKELSLNIYKKASAYALSKGIIIADTKFEFGLFDGETILIDEVLTPDSSRFWPKAKYRSGGPQESFDKQIVRDYLLTLSWDKTYPGPVLPPEVIEKTTQKYKEILNILTG
ncbi:MAG: phosphoribosylaminoimidazolesuccinocarboxamide synthase [Nitrospirae bacterium]|nr:phosphoribosylaminoimidazolesuccinocarboxamide synthase [Nitrospirota bacterium]MBF0535043.1 phosphoribosylaminoimidazolesuccinocarboxamide synthase [Nitrospirota bacterium]MBF0616551.1 phosphoribosylaminoimidazolesuccinocarboxamide synthase [Nitrospirota bacterium]